MGEYITKPVCKILMLKGEKGLKGDSVPDGGKANQYLKKVSDKDYDYAWVTIETISNAEIDSITGV